MAKVQSYIVCKLQAQKNDVVALDNTDSNNYSFDGCKDNSSSNNNKISITSAYSTSMKGLQTPSL